MSQQVDIHTSILKELGGGVVGGRTHTRNVAPKLFLFDCIKDNISSSQGCAACVPEEGPLRPSSVLWCNKIRKKLVCEWVLPSTGTTNWSFFREKLCWSFMYYRLPYTAHYIRSHPAIGPSVMVKGLHGPLYPSLPNQRTPKKGPCSGGTKPV